MIKSKTGFTLMEMLVVTLIIGILAAISVSYYGRFIERMRMTEALQLFGVAASAQERNMLKKNRYTTVWGHLDVTPTQTATGALDTAHSNPEQTHYYTNGTAQTNGEGWARPGYDIWFDQNANGKWYIVAKRIGWGSFDYTFLREFENTKIYCIPNKDHEDSVTLCMDFMGVSTIEELPGDPREGGTSPTTSLGGQGGGDLIAGAAPSAGNEPPLTSSPTETAPTPTEEIDPEEEAQRNLLKELFCLFFPRSRYCQ